MMKIILLESLRILNKFENASPPLQQIIYC
ncbi:hypothetical protein SAMN05421540_103285 [Psychroflexus halocasei]|uniref:Uncharacterized protein n=1 Tax=Psychroflexus halocasei TaxID=908615 RepID=A0A1H3YX29_9FLAO|nr:hypothetical protein SAMN05421540_103285 [Psychroflexus halocasei]